MYRRTPRSTRTGTPFPFTTRFRSSPAGQACHRRNWMNARDRLLAASAQRILVKDGPYGTEIQRARLSAEDYAGECGLSHDQKGNNDLVNLTQPQVIRRI